MKKSRHSFASLVFLIQVFICWAAVSNCIMAQNVGINDTNANPDLSAMLDVQSDSKGMLVPRMDSTHRKNISSPALGLLVFDTNTESFWYRDGSGWVELKSTGPWLTNGNKIVYTPDRKVGIGVDTPQTALQVLGDIRAQETNGADGGFRMFDSNSFERVHFNHQYSPTVTDFRIELLTPHPTDTARVLFFKNTNAKVKRVDFCRGDGFGEQRSASIGIDQEDSYFQIYGGNMGIGTSTPDANAILDVSSTTKGILFPRMTTAERTALGNKSPQNSLLVFDTNTKSYWYWVDNAWVEWKAGASTGWGLTGNSNIDPATNFVGTTDDKPLNLRVNNTTRITLDNKGRLSLIGDNNNTAVGSESLFNNQTGSSNTAFGYRALFSNTSGYENTSIGEQALYFNTIGYNNTAVGRYALQKNNDGYGNTAVGAGSLNQNTDGLGNTAVGLESLGLNTSGQFNTAVGTEALDSNTIGNENTAVGNRAGRSNTLGDQNTAIGMNALFFNQTGDANVALGYSALYHSTGVGANTAIGYNALYGNTSGIENVAIGHAACTINTTGSQNICLGKNAEVSSSNLSNAVAIGYSANVNASNKIRLGNTGITVIEGAAPFMPPSDGRFKSNLTEDIPGLDLIKILRPVSYNFDYLKFSRFLGEKNADVEQLREKEQRREMGFIAQEVEAACQKAGLPTTNLLHAPINEQDNYSMSYGQLTVPLVKAVQEQQAIIEGQKMEITELKAQLAAMQTQMQTLLSEVKAIKASAEKKDEGK